EHAIRQRHQLQAEPVGTLGRTLDQAAGLQRAEQPGGGARIDPDAARQLADAGAPVRLGYRIEQRDRPRDRADSRLAHAPLSRARRVRPPWAREPRKLAIGVGRVDSSERITVTSRPPGANRSREYATRSSRPA